jgi:heptose III glucuronosyltransferase
MNNPLLTVIVPFYNVEEYLKECLDSIFSINKADYEVLLVDDGSTDLSSEIAKTYIDKYPDKCRLITQQNSGIASTRNTGLENALGDWIIFVDSDDFIDSEGLTSVIDLLTKSEVDVFIYDAFKYVNGSGKLLEMSSKPNPFKGKGTLKGYTYIKNLMEDGVLNFVTVWDKAYRRETLIKLKSRFIPGRIHEDVAFIFQLFLNDINVQFVDKKVVYYRINREGSIMTSYSKAKLGHVVKNIETLRLDFLNHKVRDTVFFDYLVFLAGTVVKGGYKVTNKMLLQLHFTPISLRKRMILTMLMVKNWFTRNE